MIGLSAETRTCAISPCCAGSVHVHWAISNPLVKVNRWLFSRIWSRFVNYLLDGKRRAVRGHDLPKPKGRSHHAKASDAKDHVCRSAGINGGGIVVSRPLGVG